MNSRVRLVVCCGWLLLGNAALAGGFPAEIAKGSLELRESVSQADGVWSERAGEVFRDCGKCPEMVVVPAGSFMMGSPDLEQGRTEREGPMHRVTIAKPFAAGAFEVTFDEWDYCVSEGGCGGYRAMDYGYGRGRRPVVGVNWDNAQQYVSWLSQKTGRQYRLLSKAEWEYAARAGTTTPYHTGESISTDQANFNGTWLGEPYRDETLPVGRFPANAFGLHDVHGNVNEWVQDCWNENYEGAPVDGSAWETGDCSRRILRGCSAGDHAPCLRSASRGSFFKAEQSSYWGFRIARALVPATP